MPNENEFDKSEEQDADFGNTPEDNVDEIHDLYDWVFNGCRFASTFVNINVYPDISEEEFEGKIQQDVESLLAKISQKAFGDTPRDEKILNADEMSIVMKTAMIVIQSYMAKNNAW